MKSNLYEDIFQRIEYCSDTKIAIMNWLPGTKNMNYSQFQGCLHIFSGFALQNQAQSVIINEVQMEMTGLPMDKMVKWRSFNIAPNYNNAGVKKLAFLHANPDHIPYAEEKIMQSDNFPTKHFSSHDDLMDWIKL